MIPVLLAVQLAAPGCADVFQPGVPRRLLLRATATWRPAKAATAPAQKVESTVAVVRIRPALRKLIAAR
jgi:hypothetical protein